MVATSAPPAPFAPDAIREHLTRLHEGRPFEIRAIRRRKGAVYAGYFDDVESAVQAVGQTMRRGHARDVKGWYTTLNPINAELLGRVYNRLDEFPGATTSDHDATGYRYLLADVDPERPAETSSTDAQCALALARRDAIRRYLTDELAWPDPLYDAMTGNGGGLVFRTVSLPNDPETKALFERCLKALQQRFGTATVKVDETVFNPARVTKLMGTPARKGDDTPRQPHRLAVASYPPAPGEVTRAQLEQLAETYTGPAIMKPGAASGAAKGSSSRTSPGPGRPTRQWRIEDVLRDSGVGFHTKQKDGSTFYVLDRCLTSDAHADGAAVIEAADGTLSYKCLHAMCADKRWADIKERLTFPAPPASTRAAPPFDPSEPPDDGAPHPAEHPAGNSVNSRRILSLGATDTRSSGNGISVNSVNSVTGVFGEDAPLVWEAPEPLAAAAVPPFPVDALPAWMRAYVRGLAEATQTPVDLAALLAMGMLSTAAGGRVKVWIDATWQEPVNLYLAPALESGNRKSSVERRVSAPVRAWEEKRERDGKLVVADASSRRRVAERALALAEERAAKETDPGEQKKLRSDVERLVKELAALPELHAPRLLTEDSTPERLAGMMAEQGGRMAILSAEGDVFDVMAGRYSSEPNFAIFLKGHSGDPHQVDRQGRPAEYIPEPALTIAVSPQPSVLANLVNKPGFRGRGLTARFLYSLPQSLLGRRKDKPTPLADAVQEGYDRALVALLNRFEHAPIVDGEPAHHYIKPDAAADEAIHAFSREIEPQLAPGGALAPIKDWASKLTGAAVRIAGNFHLADAPFDEHRWKAPFGPDVVERAVRIARYLIPHAQAVHDLMGLDPDTVGARVVLDWLHGSKTPRFTKREAQRRNPARFKTVADLEPVLDLLEEARYLQHEVWIRPEGHRGQPPSRVYLVNPAFLSAPSSAPSPAPGQTPVTELTEFPLPDGEGAFPDHRQNSAGIDRIPGGGVAPWPAAPNGTVGNGTVASVNGHVLPSCTAADPRAAPSLGASLPVGVKRVDAAAVQALVATGLSQKDAIDRLTREGHAEVDMGPRPAPAGAAAVPAPDDDNGEVFR